MKSVLLILLVVVAVPSAIISDVAASKTRARKPTTKSGRCTSCLFGCEIAGESIAWCQKSCSISCGNSHLYALSDSKFDKCSACKMTTKALVKRLGCGGGLLKVSTCLNYAETVVGPIICGALVLTANHFITKACNRFIKQDEVGQWVADRACSKARLC